MNHEPVLAHVAEQKLVDDGMEGAAMTPRSDVAVTKVIDDGHAGPLGDAGRRPQRQCGRGRGRWHHAMPQNPSNRWQRRFAS